MGVTRIWPVGICLLALLFVPSTPAGAVLFTTDTIISGTDGTYDGQDIVVHGCTLTVNGSHSFTSLAIERGDANTPGVVTHGASFADASTKGCTLNISAGLTIQGQDGALVGSRIDVSGKGYPSEQGPGRGNHGSLFGPGGAYGGAGGDVFNATGGTPYITSPEFGSGGGAGGANPGGAGGGFIRLNITGTAVIDGAILAEGNDGALDGGAGAGGGIALYCHELSGTGAISANGGDASSSYSGGGGGGRILIQYTSNSFMGATIACGGSGSKFGGAGTIQIIGNIANPSSELIRTLTIDNGGHTGALSLYGAGCYDLHVLSGASAYSAYGVTINNVHVGPGGKLTCPPQPITGWPSVSLYVAGDCTVDAGGAISVDGMGPASETGQGKGFRYPSTGYLCGTGGGHGGIGGRIFSDAVPGGQSYGSIGNPMYEGSGGGAGSGPSGTVPGGSGAGRISLMIQGGLIVNGTISANGGDGQYSSGGGSGGSVSLACQGAFSGSGSITANGGSASSGGGGGAGGRIGISYSTKTYNGTLSAIGGTGYQAGGAGTVCLQTAGTFSTLIDNGGRAGAYTPLFTLPQGQLTVSGDAAASVSNGASVTSLHLMSGGQIVFPFTSDYALNVMGDAVIGEGCSIAADGLGNASYTGPGRGGSSLYGAGGGYGGRGGDSASGALGGPTYGSETAPTDKGSGGGRGDIYPGGAGGGEVQFYVRGTLTLNGVVSANGFDGYYSSGAGSGGTVVLSAITLTGTGAVSANGGSAVSSNAGGGGGGRIVVYYANASAFNLSKVSASGGTGYQNGDDGTVVLAPVTPPVIGVVPDDYAVKGTSYTGPTPVVTNAVAAPGFPSTTWALIEGPTDSFISSSTGVVTWPTPESSSPSMITIQATNAAGSGTLTWHTTVADTPKHVPDGGVLGMHGPPVSGVFGDDFYMQAWSRQWGIRIHLPGNSASFGIQPRLRGTLATGLNMERYIEGQAQSWTGGYYPKALAIPIKFLGGADWNYNDITRVGQKGTIGGIGLNNIGLLVRAYGRVGQIVSNEQENWFLLGDGSGTEVRVIVPAGVTINPEWQDVIVEGVCSCEYVEGQVKPIILARAAEDILPVN